MAYRGVRAILSTSPTYTGGSPFLRPYADRIEILPNGIDLAPYLDPSTSDLAEAESGSCRLSGADLARMWERHVYYKGFSQCHQGL